MHLSPDQVILWQYGDIKLNATIAFTWCVMALLCLISVLLSALTRSSWRVALEIIVLKLEQHITELGLAPASDYLVFLGTLFLFIASANLLTIFPLYEPPTASLSTTIALACCVFFAVPFFGLRQGVLTYLRGYLEPTVLMLPFNIIGEVSRTLALAVRLFGNMMSGSMIMAILLSIAPLIFPIIMTLLGLLTGLVQAYIFTVLAAVYIAAAQQQDEQRISRG